jgi:hypothetical protein
LRETVGNQRAANTSGHFRAQRQAFPTAIGEAVHFLGNHIGSVTKAAGKNARVFKNGGGPFFKAVKGGNPARGFGHRMVAAEFLTDQVTRATGGLQLAGHGVSVSCLEIGGKLGRLRGVVGRHQGSKPQRKARQFLARDLPEDINRNITIIMDQLVAHTDHKGPRNIRMRLSPRPRKAPRCLTNHRDTARDSRLMELARMEAGLIEITYKTSSLLSPSEHVQKQRRVPFRRRQAHALKRACASARMRRRRM